MSSEFAISAILCFQNPSFEAVLINNLATKQVVKHVVWVRLHNKLAVFLCDSSDEGCVSLSGEILLPSTACKRQCFNIPVNTGNKSKPAEKGHCVTMPK